LIFVCSFHKHMDEDMILFVSYTIAFLMR